MDEREIIETLRRLMDDAGVPTFTAEAPARQRSAKNLYALRSAIVAIESLAKARENIDSAKTPADMIFAMYAVTEPCGNVNGPVQNCKVADMAAQVDAVHFLDPSTPMSEVDAAIRKSGGDPNAIGRRGAELVAGLVAKRKSAQVFDPEKVRALLEAIRCGAMGDEIDEAARAVRDSEAK
jgi:hypothetical protein